MPKLSSRSCLPFRWPAEEPAPFPQARTGLPDLIAGVRGAPGWELAPEGPLDPVAIARARPIPGGLALRLLDRLYHLHQPVSPVVLDRFIDAYLLTALRGCRGIQPRGRRRRHTATAALRAMQLMDDLFRSRWQKQMSPPAEWWKRFLETFRSLGTAHLLAVRCPSLYPGPSLSPLRVASGLLLRAVSDPFAWEPELFPHLDRLLGTLADEVLLFPAESPTAYAEGRPGRFLFDTNSALPPVPPEILDDARPSNGSPQWWIMDAGRPLARIAEHRRSLALGISPAKVHPLFSEIPDAPRRILLERLERILGRTHRRARPVREAATTVHLAVGLEQAVRHCFAHRLSGSADPGSLHTNVRLQSEVGTRGGTAENGLAEWQVIERTRDGMRLRGPVPAGPPLTGRVVVVLNPRNRSESSEVRVGIVRWEQIDPQAQTAHLGLEVLKASPQDCWCRTVSSMGTPLHEHPGLLLEERPSVLLVPAGLFQSGAMLAARVDDRDHPVQLLRLQEEGVHFELIEVRLSARD